MEKERLRRTPEAAAVTGAVLSGLAAHGFAMVQLMHNYDNILQQPKGLGAGITSGRWLLSLLEDITTPLLDLNYNLPFVNGLIFLAVLAVVSGFVVNILRIEKTSSAVLTGCLIATFPTAAATMAFRYTAPYYGLSLLLAVQAVWFAQNYHHVWVGSGLAAVCLALSMGIYQAYPPVAIGLFVLILMREALEEQAQLAMLIRKGLRFCAVLILGVGLYFLLLKLCMVLYSTQTQVVLDSYQGIGQMGQISLVQLPGLVAKAWLSGALFTVRDYCSLTATPILKVLWTLLLGMILMLSVLLLVRRKTKPLLAAFFCVMGLLFPLAVNFIVVMCPQGIVYTIMVYAFVLVGIAPLMLLELLPKTGKKQWVGGTIAVLLVAVVFYNSYYANLNYTSLYYANRQVENYLSGMVAQIRMTPGYTAGKQWAILGQIEDPKLYNIWNQEPTYGGFIGSDAKGLMQASYSFDCWFHNYIGYETDFLTPEQKLSLANDPRVKQMPCWPSAGSIQVVDEFVVIKCQDLTLLPETP